MTDELEHKLVTSFPTIFTNTREYNGYQIWNVDCGDGWFNLLFTLCGQIQHYIDHAKIFSFRAVQVKEKFGGLRFYVVGADERIRGLIAMAEAMSYKICERCGNAGKPTSEGWVVTLCNPCRGKNKP